MPRFFFHLRAGSDEVLDSEGRLLPADAVADAALLEARDCIAGDVMTGRLDLHSRIDVYDAAGELVHSLGFADAVEMVAAP